MRLVTPDMIPKIDKYAADVMNIPERELMGRAGRSVARAVRELSEENSRIIIFAGSGNNGGDGYAAAVELASDRSVTLCDLFGIGQRSDAGRHWMAKARECGIDIVSLAALPTLDSFDVAVDAVFGTGFHGEYPECVISLACLINESNIKVVAVDVPIGINALDGSVETFALRADVTVALSYIKVGELSCPARDFVGRIVLDGLGIESAHEAFEFYNFLTDESLAAALLPKRIENSNKGSFGKLLMVTGSDKFRGAAHLSLEGALRSGVGYVRFCGDGELCRELRMKYPEAIYLPLSDTDTVITHSRDSVTLVGSGCGSTVGLCRLVEALLLIPGAPLVLDADAINAIASFSSPEIFKRAERSVVLTPHPLEFSRISGMSVDHINSHRLSSAQSFAREYGVTLLLKGRATVITDGKYTYINSSGSSALAKAGSGDVLAGALASLLAQSPTRVCEMTALAAYLHGAAGDSLAQSLSEYGVTPSDLPIKIAERMRSLTERK